MLQNDFYRNDEAEAKTLAYENVLQFVCRFCFICIDQMVYIYYMDI